MTRPKQQQELIAFSTIAQALVALDHGADLIVRTPGGNMMRLSDDHVHGIVQLLRSHGAHRYTDAPRFGEQHSGSPDA